MTADRFRLVLAAVIVTAVVILVAVALHHRSSSTPATPTGPRVVPCYDTSGGVHPSYDGISC